MQANNEQKGTMTKVAWKADPAHSEISFRVKHLMITNVTGILKEYEVNAYSDGESFSDIEVNFTGKTASITTGNEQRDKHLMSADFFDVESHPEIRFHSTEVVKENNAYRMNGELTIRNVTKPISLHVESQGVQKDPWGGTRAGFTVTGKINRLDFGLTWNVPLEKGGILVSEEVRISAELQFVKQS
jgi:polyisoprenoid-binding protein YceI